MSDQVPGNVETVIVGSGFSGICLAIKLLKDHRTSFLLIDKSNDLGGTWNFNRYPGCACDIPSHLYSFSFEHNPDWTHMYADRAQIHDYLKFCAKKYSVLPHLLLKTEMLEAFWDDAAAIWHVKVLTDGVAATVDARFLVSAAGVLHVPKYPEIRGRENFAGSSFHSSSWDSSLELKGKAVAVIGTGASAIQIVPEIAAVARKLYVFQRTPAWILPKPQFRIHPQWRKLLRRLPILMALFYSLLYWAHEFLVLLFLSVKFMRRAGEKIALRHMERYVGDPELRAALRPNYELGCKRVLLSNDFYAAIGGSNVEVVTRGIKEVREKSIVSDMGDEEEREQEVDVIVYATGFDLLEARLQVVGRGGLELRNAEQKSMLGVTKAGFPNFFMLLGPNTLLGHSSVIVMVEAQVAYIVSCMNLLTNMRTPACTLELRHASQDRFQEFLRRRFPRTVWYSGNCHGWYFHPHSDHIIALWPASTLEYWYRTRYASSLDYHFR